MQLHVHLGETALCAPADAQSELRWISVVRPRPWATSCRRSSKSMDSTWDLHVSSQVTRLIGWLIDWFNEWLAAWLAD